MDTTPAIVGFSWQQGRADTPFELTGRLRKAYFGGTDDPTPTEDSDTSASIRLRGEEAGKFRASPTRKVHSCASMTKKAGHLP